MKFSSSMLATWATCQKQAEFKFVDHLPDDGTHAKTWFGTAVHAALEDFNLNDDGEMAKAIFLSMWDRPEIYGGNITEWRGSQFGTLRLRGVKIIEEYVDKQLWEKREVIATEHKFMVPFGEHFLSGIVDLVEFKLSGRGVPTLKIVDYKTTSSKPTLEELRLNLQFTIYTYASLQPEFWLGFDETAETGWHPPLVQKYPPMENGQELMERFAETPRRAAWSHLWGGVELDAGERSDEDFERMYVLLNGIERAVEHKVFIPSISAASCKWCPYKEVCRAVAPVYDKMMTDPSEDDEMF